MNILIAPDSFKDCLNAAEVAKSIRKGILQADATAQTTLLPLSDGGEGFVDTLLFGQAGELKTVAVHDALGRPLMANYGYSRDQKTAIIEMAAASGIEHLTAAERNPLIASTFGTGELIKDALDNQCKTILIGIGGSATNDGGTGMARALGFRLLDNRDQPVPEGGGYLHLLRRIDATLADKRLQSSTIIVACDVTNPLTGPKGASVVYGPQKGANTAMIEQLDSNLTHLASVMSTDLKKDLLDLPGGGAAGGLGAGLVAFANATLTNGFELVSRQLHLEDQVRKADLIFTGEGKIDQQTSQGKTPWGVAQLAQKYQKPLVALGGTLGEGYRNLYHEGFTAIFAIGDGPGNLEHSLVNARDLLATTSEKIYRLFIYAHSVR